MDLCGVTTIMRSVPLVRASAIRQPCPRGPPRDLAVTYLSRLAIMAIRPPASPICGLSPSLQELAAACSAGRETAPLGPSRLPAPQGAGLSGPREPISMVPASTESPPTSWLQPAFRPGRRARRTRSPAPQAPGWCLTPVLLPCRCSDRPSGFPTPPSAFIGRPATAARTSKGPRYTECRQSRALLLGSPPE